MQITSLQQAKRDKERVNVFVDNDFWAGLEQNTLVKYHLFQGKEVTPELLAEILIQDSVDYLTRKLYEWSLARPRSSRELKDKIAERIAKRQEHNPEGFETKVDMSQIVEMVLAKLAEMGYDDLNFARWYVNERVRQGKSGPRKITSELLAKGVNQKTIREVLAEQPVDTDILRKSLLQKKFGVESLNEIKDIKLKARAYRYLQSKGV